MTKKKLLAGLILLAVGSLLIAACSAKQPTTTSPTIDANAIYTQAAQTVQAGLAQTEVVQPTAPATETVQPTNTMDANMVAALTSTAQSVMPGNATATVAGQATAAATKTLVVLPTATKAVVGSQPKNTGDQASLFAQDPPDGATAHKNDIITVRLTLKNTGTTTWIKGRYALVYYAGDKMGSPNDFQMTKDVKPGDTIQLIFTLTAPDSAGTKKIIWVVQNADGVNF